MKLSETMDSFKRMGSDLGLLFVVALFVRLLTACLVQNPGYMDAYYYTVGGLQLYRGQGFREPFIWNYLQAPVGVPADVPADAPAAIPHPGYLYWMPLSSILAYLSFLLFGPTFRAAQAPFVILSSLLPAMSYWVAYQVAHNRRHAWCAGLFTVFSGFYMAYWVVPDNFAPFALAGAFCLYALGKGLGTGQIGWFAVAGIGAGLAHLSRSDGVLLVFVVLAVGVMQVANGQMGKWRMAGRSTSLTAGCLLFAICYLLLMAPWFLRNIAIIGRPMSTVGVRTLWLTDYDDLYSYGRELSLRTYLAWGWGHILRSKLDGLWVNLQTLLAVDWIVVLAPLGMIGVWRLRRHALFVPAWLYGASLYLTMSLGFTFPGMRGAMLHSSVALLPFLFAAVMDGLDVLVQWIASRRRHWHARQAQRVFSAGIVCIVALVSVFLYAQALPRYRGAHVYAQIGQWMEENAVAGERVLVNDPAAFYYHSRRECLVVPNEGAQAVLTLADAFDVEYLILDKNTPSPLRPLYDRPEGDARFEPVGRFQDREGEAVYVYRIHRSDKGG